MKILFSPSEGKTNLMINEPINSNSFIFPKLYNKRIYILNNYNNYIHSLSNEELNKYFAIKNGIDFKINLFKEQTCKAIQRYNGVAYDYLEYNNLNTNSQKYIDENTLIFSNLFGVIKANDFIPIYRMKQGQNLPNIEIAKYYKQEFSKSLDDYLQNELVLDLRAEYYNKFYKPKNYITMKFIKNGKVVSHWAKAYRGIVLKSLAEQNIQTQQDILNLEIPNLSIKEIQTTKNTKTIIYEIRG